MANSDGELSRAVSRLCYVNQNADFRIISQYLCMYATIIINQFYYKSARLT